MKSSIPYGYAIFLLTMTFYGVTIKKLDVAV